MRTYIGVDNHRGHSRMTAADESGKICMQGRPTNQLEAAREFTSQAGTDGNCAALLESTRNWAVVHDWLEEPVGRVHPAHSFKVKAIAEARIKTDKIDAKVLAHLLAATLCLKPMCQNKPHTELRLFLAMIATARLLATVIRRVLRPKRLYYPVRL